MSATTSIEWTDRTWNPCVGCSIVSPGCHNCYAATMAKRLRAMALADIAAGREPGRKRHYIDVVDDDGRWTGKVMPVPEALGDPLKWGKPKMVFVNSMSDLFHESLYEWFITLVFASMFQSRQHTFQVLTKRPHRMLAHLRREFWHQEIHAACKAMLGYNNPQRRAFNRCDLPLRNVIVGTSIEDQKRADTRFGPLCELGEAGWRTMVSIEPLLGPVTIPDRYLALGDKAWVIVGGESGHGSRQCDTRSIHSIVEQCRGDGVACFVKQLGARPTGMTPETLANVRSPKGGDIDEWPLPLRVREMPSFRRDDP